MRRDESVYTYANVMFRVEYQQKHARRILGAISTIFSFGDRLDGGGVYVFVGEGAEQQKEVLYIGKTDSFPRRIKQHHFATPAKSNKRAYLERYFAGSSSRQLSLFLIGWKRLPLLGEPATLDDVERRLDDHHARDFERRRSRTRLERILIGTHLTRAGVLPTWSREDEIPQHIGDSASVEADRLISWMLDRDDASMDLRTFDLLETARKFEALIEAIRY